MDILALSMDSGAGICGIFIATGIVRHEWRHGIYGWKQFAVVFMDKDTVAMANQRHDYCGTDVTNFPKNLNDSHPSSFFPFNSLQTQQKPHRPFDIHLALLDAFRCLCCHRMMACCRCVRYLHLQPPKDEELLVPFWAGHLLRQRNATLKWQSICMT